MAMGFVSLVALADAVSIEDFTIQPGETKTLGLLLDNSIVYKSLQCDIDLPEGLQIATDSNGRPIFNATERTSTHIIQGSHPAGSSENHYRVGMITMSSPISGNSGPVVTFSVTASETFVGYHEIALTNIRVGDENNVSHHLNDTVCNVTCGITLANVLETGEDGKTYAILDDLAIVASASKPNLVFTTDGNDNWLEVEAGNGMFGTVSAMPSIKGGTLVGTLSNVGTNPTLTISVMPQAGDEMDVEIKNYPLSVRFAPRTSEVLYVEGYYFTDEGSPKLRGYRGTNGSRGQSGDLDMSWIDGDTQLQEAAKYRILVVAHLKEAWEPEDDSPSGISMQMKPSDNLAFQNYTLMTLELPEAPITTGLNEINMDETGDNTYYNLLGQPVTNPTPGIYIKNGKKVIVK